MIDYSKCEDNTLQDLASKGDRAAEEALAKRYIRLVRICARPLFLAGGDHEDLIQEGMFGLLSAIRQYDPEHGTAFKTFAELCIRRKLISAIKAASSTKHIPLNAGLSLEVLLSEQCPSADFLQLSPEEEILQRENEMHIRELLSSFFEKLSKLEKQVFINYLKGLSYREIALLCSKDEKSVDNAIQRIRNKLAKCLRSGVNS